MNIILIGMRGSGKSTVGKLLAQKLGREFIDMDTLITRKAGKPIRDIVLEQGWEIFRDLESEVVADIADKDNTVIATGGGVILREKNVTLLKKKGKFIWLQGAIDTFMLRIGEDPNRLSLTGKPMRQDMEETLKTRKVIYERVADFVIDTETKEPKEIIKEIIKLYGLPGLSLRGA